MRSTLFPLLTALLLCCGDAAAQSPDVREPWFVTIGSNADDRVRLEQLTGGASTAGYLMRSAASMSPVADTAADRRLSITTIAPRLRYVFNSAIPLSLNEGSLWAGRGTSVEVMGGLRSRLGSVVLTVAPRLALVENRDFDFIGGDALGRSVFSPPWREGRFAADLPLRFGSEPFALFHWGESAIAVETAPLAFGFTSQEQWWGPGIRNALIMSNHAPGFPHAFIRTARPISTRFGNLEARWITGGLTESLYFDTTAANDLRALSGLVVAFSPAVEPNLTLGFARTVTMPASGVKAVARRAFVAMGISRPETSDSHSSIFARWVFPRDGAELYAEWAHRRAFTSVRHFLEQPEQTQGYTLGFQWAGAIAGDSGRSIRVQTEVTNLEQGVAGQPAHEGAGSFYTGEELAQGYTHRGRVLGAAIGPGASSQWVAVDHVGGDWSAGLTLGRIRWDNDVFYTRPTGWSFMAHDVSLLLGARGSIRASWVGIGWEIIREKRNNYLYQNPSTTFESLDAIDVRNWSLRISLLPVF